MSSKLFVGGLSWGTDDEMMRSAFAKFGDITEAKVILDRDTGRSRGFGFVTFTSASDAVEATKALDGTDLDGRTIRVNEAQERSGGGGGRGRDDRGGHSNRW